MHLHDIGPYKVYCLLCKVQIGVVGIPKSNLNVLQPQEPPASGYCKDCETLLNDVPEKVKMALEIVLKRVDSISNRQCSCEMRF